MNGVVLETLPMALAIALSPFGVIPAILLLFAPSKQAGAAAFLLGWFGGVATAFLVAVWLATQLAGLGPLAWVPPLRLGIGVLLVIFGVRQWLRRALPAPRPAWLAALDRASAAQAMRIGVLLSLANPKVLLLAFAGGITAERAGVALTSGLLLVAVAFAAVASISVAAPLVLVLLFGDRAVAPLSAARDWLDRNAGAATALVMVAIGVALLSKGLG